MNKVYSILSVILLLATVATAQTVKLSESPEQFLTDLQKLMNAGGAYTQKAEKNLETLFTENRLSAPQKERVIALSRKLNAKRYQPVQQFAPFYEALYQLLVTQQVSPAEVDNYLTIAEKSFEKYDPKNLSKVLETIRVFAEKRFLYTNNYNKLYANGGTFTLRFADPNAPAPTSNADTLAAKKTPVSKPGDSDGWDLPVDSSGKVVPLMSSVDRKPIPVLAGPLVEIKGVDLVMTTANDSVVVKKTDGALLLKDGMWVGKGGSFSWESAGQPETFVTLADYAFAVANPKITADDVLLTFKPLAKPIKGTFEFDSKKRVARQAPTYPRFMSWSNDVVLSNLGNGITYKGGIALVGTKLFGSAANGQPSLLQVSFKGKPAFKASSKRFEFADSVISSPLVSFTGYIDAADTLYHPGVAFRYDRETGIARLSKAEKSGYSDTYFSDSYHKFYIQPEIVRWDLPRQKVDFYQLGAKKEVPVRFESFDFFYPERYAGMSADFGFHPLQLAANYITTKKTQTFFADDLAIYAKMNPSIMRNVLNRMMALGYIDMDPKSEEMRLSRKGVLYVLANAHKKDYDNFLIRSTYPSNDSTTNATINLTDKFLTIRGVEKFSISDSLKITAVPTDKTLRIGKNRAFTLTGQLKSGNMRYTGRDLGFNYDQFSMNMTKIDSITFTPQGKNQEIGGDIQYEKPGTVFLADKGNKSGRQKDKKTTQRLLMPEGMTVYFNQPNRGSLVYNKKVYFKVPAVDNDSLGKGDIAFDGTFFSDGIFPPIKTTLKSMPDNSLGFEHTAPAAGYPIYGGKGNLKFTGKLVMDKKGLRAEGVISHLNASLPAKDILMTPDSVLASGESGQIKEGLVGKAYFPAVNLKNYVMKWFPKADSMKISTKADHFSFYNGTTNLAGDLVMRSSGLFGKGTVKRTDSEAQSENIKFNKEGFTAGNAQFRVMADKQGTATKPMLLGTKVDLDFNQVKGVVTIATNNSAANSFSDTLMSSLEFPNAAYKTSISKAQWNIAAKTITMKAAKTSTFTATAEEQEGLTFNGASAVYDVDKATLNISGVPYVTSADARIYPEKGLITIKRNGEMLPLKNARLELDTTSLFHKLKGGNIQIQSRTRFAGDAIYQFAAAKGDTANIKMGSFELKEAAPVALASNSRTAGRKGKNGSELAKTYYTVARADVDERDNVTLAPKVAFKGSITMMAPEQDLKLEGAIKIALKKRPKLVSDWIPMKEKIGETFSIKVDQTLKNDGNQPLTAGLHFRGGGSAGLYPTFLSTKESDKDDDLFRATGVMTYDEKEKVFRIVKKDAAGLEDVEGAFTFNDASGVMNFQGPVNLMNTGMTGSTPNNLVFAAGTGRAQVDSSTMRLNALVGFALPIPQPVNAAIADKIVKANLDEKNDEPADDDLDRLTAKLAALIGQKATDVYRVKAQNQHVSITQAAPKFAASLVLSNVNLRWSEKYNALYSVGSIGVSNIDNVDINAEMEGFVEIRKHDGGDEATIYLEASPDIWFYWDYKSGGGATAQLALLTSDQELNDRIMAGGKNGGKSALSIVPADVFEKTQFTDRYMDQYKTREKPKPQPKAAATKDAPKKVVEKKKEKADEKKEGF
ncbi:hypothetical protein [Larkinella rosea]|uniref:Translocation/assembly module TamB n=1 Tax=Larkinella rosea TaxID=2025312 RepID=A0A3P1BCC9_9BACT|nr:hypothetical protein [Larkinella rosea]RRA98750.1 hypothetical protein EHT25_27545 [Larkinella rosea]